MDEEIERLRQIIDDFPLGVLSVSEHEGRKIEELKKCENYLKSKNMVLHALNDLSELGMDLEEDSDVVRRSVGEYRQRLQNAAAEHVMQQAACRSGIFNAAGLQAKAVNTTSLSFDICALLEVFDKVLDLYNRQLKLMEALRNELSQHKQYLEKRQEEATQLQEDTDMDRKLKKKMDQCNIIRHMTMCFIRQNPSCLINKKYIGTLEFMREPISEDNIDEVFDIIMRVERENHANDSENIDAGDA